MKVFYFCQTGVHTALIAGYLHLGFLPEDVVPNNNTFFNLKGFDSLGKNEIGKIIFLGIGKEGLEIYSLGVLNERQLGITAIKNLLNLYNLKDDEYMLIDTFDCLNKWIRMGTRLRSLGLNYFAVKLICFGLKKNYFKICDLVKSKKRNHKNVAENL